MAAEPPKAKLSRSSQPSFAVDEGFLILRLCGGEITVDSIIIASRSSRTHGDVTASLLHARALSDDVAGVTRPLPLTLTLPRVTPAS